MTLNSRNSRKFRAAKFLRYTVAVNGKTKPSQFTTEVCFKPVLKSNLSGVFRILMTVW